MRASANRRRVPNLHRGDESKADTWRCPNVTGGCGVWVVPTLAREPDTCHLCGTPRDAGKAA